MTTFIKNTYLYLVTLPDRLYPFRCEIEGQWVRGRRSYEQAVERALVQHGLHRLGYKLTLYRETFHFVGSVVLVVAATIVSKTFFGSETALYVLLGTVIVALFFQEFYLHPKLYGQRYKKGVIDLLSWITPMAAYFFLFK
ncbi:MAG: hypothetical protein JWL87_278 [Candidatus Adlerbacteria bacterium]|nr:hypothetical protein [Candidatus Adlerbacteria bacterium]